MADSLESRHRRSRATANQRKNKTYEKLRHFDAEMQALFAS